MCRWSRTNSGRLIRRSLSPPLDMVDIGAAKFSAPISKGGEGDLLINLPLFVRDQQHMQC